MYVCNVMNVIDDDDDDDSLLDKELTNLDFTQRYL
jgi:hypothetical protein